MRKATQTGCRFSPKQGECGGCETPHHAAKPRAGARGQEDERAPSCWTERGCQTQLYQCTPVSLTVQARERKVEENSFMKKEKAFNAGTRERQKIMLL